MEYDAKIRELLQGDAEEVPISYQFVEEAWGKKKYDDVLLLLQKDSVFPRSFEYQALSDEGVEKLLKNFARKRIRLHEAIQNDDLNMVKELTSEKSRLYLNPVDESAANAAIKHRRFRIYAYLKSIGAGLMPGEYYEMGNLSYGEKNHLREILDWWISKNTEEVIVNLYSKSKSLNAPEDFEAKVKNYYHKLNEKIPEILQVVSCETDAEILFDFDDSGAFGVCGTSNASGVTSFAERKIYVGCRRPVEELLGTLAHELAHLAMEIIFKNNAEPFGISDEQNRIEFGEITRDILCNLKISGSESKITLKAFTDYESYEYQKELIVRVPHILAQFKNGQKWLEENVPGLWQYYQLKILPKCEEFLRQSHLIKRKNIVKTFNEKVGEINNLKICQLFFQNADSINFNQKLNFLITKNTRLGLLRVLQAFYGKNYIFHYDNFIVLNLENFTSNLQDLESAFLSEGTDSLILECKSLYKNRKMLEEVLETVKKWNTNKKIVFVVEENQEKIIGEVFENEQFGLKTDDNFNLNDLDPKSLDAFLNKTIIFQENEMTLREMLGDGNDCFDYFNAYVIGMFLENKKHRIGSKIFGMSSMEGPYAQVFSEVNVDSLLDQIETSSDVFLFTWDDEIFKILNVRLEEIDLRKHIVNKNKILWSEEITENDFQRFCENNPHCRIHLIALNGDKFILEKIYNPNFYMEREIEKIVMKTDKINGMISELKSDIFLITGENNFNLDLGNVKNIDPKEIEKKLKESTMNTHWFQWENDVLVWKDSSNSTSNIKLYVDKDLSAQHFIGEDDFIQEILHKKLLVLADEPGTGKSTTITKFYESVRENHWIIRINLKDHSNAIRQFDSLTMKNVLNILKLFDGKSSNELSSFFLELMLNPLKTFPKCLLLIFDGFDELLDEKDRTKALNLFKFLINKTKAKIWITSRSHLKNILQDELGTVSFRLHPINNDKKKSFIRKYYMDRLNIVLDKVLLQEIFEAEGTQLHAYVENFAKNMEFIFKEDLSMGTPLQLNLMLENSLEHFTDWMEKPEAVLSFSYFGGSLFEVYENYINRKYDFFFKKSNCYKTELIQTKSQLDLHHKKLAMLFIDSETSLTDFEKNSLLPVGLVQLQGENFQFSHFTFREFYCSKICFEYMTGKMKDESDCAAEFFKKAFVDPGYELIRKFIDGQIQKENVKINIQRLQIKEYGDRLGFENERRASMDKFYEESSGGNKEIDLETFIQNLTQLRRDDPSYEILFKKRTWPNVLKPEQYLHTNVLEKNNHLFQFLFSNLSFDINNFRADLIISTNGSGYNLLHCAAVADNLETGKDLFDVLKNMSPEEMGKILCKRTQSVDRDSILHLALKHGNLKILQQMLKMPEKRRLFGMRKQEDGGTVLHVAVSEDWKPEVMQLLFAEAKKILPLKERISLFKARNYEKENILHIAVKRNFAIVKMIIDEAKKILPPEEFRLFLTARNHFKYSILHFAKNFEIQRLLLEEVSNILPNNEFGLILTAKTEFQDNVLHIASKFKDSEVLALIIKEAQSILSSKDAEEFFTAEDNRECNVLHLAIESRNYAALKLLLDRVKNFVSPKEMKLFFMAQEGKRNNILHLAAEKNDLEIAKLILKKAEEILSLEERQNFLTAQNVERNNALYLAVSCKNHAMVQLLLDEAEEILSRYQRFSFLTTKNLYRKNPLDHAATYSFEILKLLINACKKMYGPKALQKFFTQTVNLFDRAAQNDEALKLILSESEMIMSPEERHSFFKAQIGFQNSFFFTAVESSTFELIKLLLDYLKTILSPQEWASFFKEQNKLQNNVLHLAAELRRFEVIKLLLNETKEKLCLEDRKTFFLAQNSNNRNILHIAVEKNELKIAELVLDEAEELLSLEEQRSFFAAHIEFGYNILHVAAKFNNLELITLLLNKAQTIFSPEELRSFFKAESDEKTNVLLIGVKNRNTEAVELWLEEAEKMLTVEELRLFLMSQNGVRSNVLHIAAESGKSELIKLLLDEAKKILTPEEQRSFFSAKNILGNSVLHVATYCRNSEGLKFLLDEATDILSPEELPLFFMSQNEEKDNILNTCVAWATEIGQIKLILDEAKKILSPEEQSLFFMSPNERGENCLYAAASRGKPDVVELFLDEAGNILDSIERCLFVTAKNNKGNTVFNAPYDVSTVLHLLMDKTRNVLPSKLWFSFFMTVNNKMDNILHSRSHSLEQMRWILNEAENSLSSKERFLLFTTLNKKGQNILHTSIISMFHNCKKIKFILHEAKKILPRKRLCSFFTAKDEAQNNVLHLAADSYKLKILKLLLDESKKLLPPKKFRTFFMAKNNKKLNALHVAASNSDEEKVKLLLDEAEKILSHNDQRLFLTPETSDGNGDVENLKLSTNQSIRALVDEAIKNIQSRGIQNSYRQSPSRRGHLKNKKKKKDTVSFVTFKL